MQLAAAGSIASGAYANTFTAHNHEFYWYGTSAGIAFTVCVLELKGDAWKADALKGYAHRFTRGAIRCNEICSDSRR